MRNTLLPSANSLDHQGDISEVANEVTAPINNHPAVNSLVATGGLVHVNK
jgi:hypothetical protein